MLRNDRLTAKEDVRRTPYARRTQNETYPSVNGEIDAGCAPLEQHLMEGHARSDTEAESIATTIIRV